MSLETGVAVVVHFSAELQASQMFNLRVETVVVLDPLKAGFIWAIYFSHTKMYSI